MKLYGFPPSPNTWKVRAVAAHLGVPLELEIVDLTKGGSHTPDYLAINPDRPHAGAGRWRFQAVRNPPRSCSTSRARSRTRSGRTTHAPGPTSRAGRAGSSRTSARRAASRCCSTAGQAASQYGRARTKPSVAKGLECFNKEARGARRASGKAAVSGRQRTDARRFLGRGAVVLCRRAELPLGALRKASRTGSLASRRCRAGAKPRRTL